MFIFILVMLFKTIIIIGHVMYVMYFMYVVYFMYVMYVMCWIIVFDRPISIRGINTKNILISIMIFGISYSISRNSLNIIVIISLNFLLITAIYNLVGNVYFGYCYIIFEYSLTDQDYI